MPKDYKENELNITSREWHPLSEEEISELTN